MTSTSTARDIVLVAVLVGTALIGDFPKRSCVCHTTTAAPCGGAFSMMHTIGSGTASHGTTRRPKSP